MIFMAISTGKERVTMARIKITKEDFQRFKRECGRWIKYFGLFGWEVTYRFCRGDNDSFAWYNASYSGRAITISLNKRAYDWFYSDRALMQAAFHEVMEGMLLGGLKMEAEAWEDNHRDKVLNYSNEVIHNAVRIFENTVWRDLFNEIQRDVSDLPVTAQKACELFVRDGTYVNNQAYVDDYFRKIGRKPNGDEFVKEQKINYST